MIIRGPFCLSSSYSLPFLRFAGLTRTCVFTFKDILTLLSHLLGYAKFVYTIFTNQSRAMTFCVAPFDCLYRQNREFVSQGFPQWERLGGECDVATKKVLTRWVSV
jgi:hypothetical protein